ncbi:hypothetical protein [Blastococcus sp. SYSU DS0617]
MRLSRVLLAGAAVAAAGIATSAFTASNTVPDSVAGYGQGLVTGATVTDINYVANVDDGTILDAVVFTVTTDITNATSTMTLKSGADSNGDGGNVVGDPYACSVTTGWDAGAPTPFLLLTCDTTVGGPRNFEDFNSVGLTVLQ